MSSNEVSIFWGNAELCPVTSRDPVFKDWLEQFVLLNGLDGIACLKQEHLPTGYIINAQKNALHDVSLFDHVGDFLITNQVAIGLVVLTADCLPIVLYDSVKRIVGIVHAGWKGSCTGVVRNAVLAMQQQFACVGSSIKVYFGAHARECCYEVQQDFLQHIELAEKSPFIITKKNRFYFNNAAYVTNQLEECGIAVSQIDNTAACTICDVSYYSWRRDKAAGFIQPRGQASIVWIRP